MNNIRNIEKLNQSELDLGIPYSASWHQDFSHTAYIFFAGLSYDLTEGDILIIFSQYGIPVHMKLVRDKETGKSKGFGWLKYEDQRSTVLAVDNLNGAKILGRVMKVDHAVYEERERDEEYEALLEEELKNDFADLEELKKAKNGKKNEDEGDDDEFRDPLLLMSKTKDEDHHRRSHRSRNEHSGRRRHHEEDRERRSHRSHSDKEKEKERDRDREVERRSEKGHRGQRDRDSSRSYRDREGDRRSETRSHRERDEKYRESRSRRDENDDERRDKDSRSERTIGGLEQPTHKRNNETNKYCRRYREPEPEPESSTSSNIQSAADVGKDSNRLANEREEDLEL